MSETIQSDFDCDYIIAKNSKVSFKICVTLLHVPVYLIVHLPHHRLNAQNIIIIVSVNFNTKGKSICQTVQVVSTISRY